MMVDNNQLLYDFSQLKSYKELENIMSKTVNCQLQLWILEICDGSHTSQRLLYSWIIPTDYNDGKWYKADVEVKRSPNLGAYKANIKKFTLYSDGESISSLILELLKGKTISEACENLILTKPPKEISEFSFRQSPENTYAVRPPIFLETESMNLLYKEDVRSIQSPSRYVSCISASLFHLQKKNIFVESDLPTKTLDDAGELARFCINTLKKETGLNFDGSDSNRLGNIEWIMTPLLNPEKSPLDFSTVKENLSNQNDSFSFNAISSREVDVYLQSGLKFSNNKLLIRCRLRNNHEVVLDQIKQVDVNIAEQGLRFSANQQVSRVHLTVWIADSEDGDWDIWYEQDTPLMREVNMAMGLVGLQGNIKLSTLEEWRNSKKIEARVQHYEEVKQTSYRHSNIAGYVHDPWTPASKEINNYVRRLFPSKSKGRFFPKGWGENIPSALSFAEWFKSITSNTESKLISIIDPYFDTVGIELIAHTPTTNNSFEVITCTQVISNDDKAEMKQSEIESPNKNLEPERANRIKMECENLRLILSRLQLKILDIRGSQGGKGSYFHDRYILIYDFSGNVSEGYHLSNSLQAATKFDPLLITPIPADILTEVASYVDALRNAQPPTVNKASAIQIYPEEVTNNTTSRPDATSKGDKKLLRKITNSSLFFTELLQAPDIVTADVESIKQKLLENKLIAPDSFQFVVGNEENICERLYSFSEKLLHKRGREFSLLWESFSSWLANVVDSEKYLYKVSDYHGVKLGERIMSYLLNPSDILNEGNNEAQEINIHQKNYFLDYNFKESLYEAHLSLDKSYGNRLYGNYHLEYATKAILYMQPSLLINTIEKLQEGQKRHEGNVLFVIRAYLLDGLIIHLLFRPCHNLINSLLLSSVPSLRGLGSQARGVQLNEIEVLSNPHIYNLTELNDTERIFAFAEWIYHLRIKANRIRNESQELKSIRVNLYNQIRQCWPNNVSQSDKNAIIRRLSGPSNGDWSKDIYYDLALGLVQDQKITRDEAILYWINLLLEKIEGSSKGNVTFFAATDILLTELCAGILYDLSEEVWNEKIKELRRLINKCNREVRRPFAKSNNFDVWNEVKKQGLWLKTFLELAYHTKNAKKLEIEELLGRMDNKLKDTSDSTNQSLSDFAKRTSCIN